MKPTVDDDTLESSNADEPTVGRADEPTVELINEPTVELIDEPGVELIDDAGLFDGPDEHRFDRSRWADLVERSIHVKLMALLGFGVVFALVFSALGQTPADGPTGTLADEILIDPAPLIVRGPTPTTVPDPEAEVTTTTLNPNAIFVDPEAGRDDATGSDYDTAIRSLTAALQRVEPGQTIYLASGRYSDLAEPGNAHYVLSRGGTPDAWVTVEAAPGQTPEIIGSNGNGFEVRADYVEVKGLTVRGEGFPTNTDPYGVGIQIRNSHHVRLVDNDVSGFPVSGISGIESSNLTLLNNEVYENAFWSSVQGSGISFWHLKTEGEPPDADGYHDRIMGNRIYRNENRVMSRWKNHEVITDGNGIIIDQGYDTGYEGRVLIANNVIFDNGGRAVLIFESANADVMNNTVYHNARTPDLDGGPTELAAGRAANVRFVNNLVLPRPGSRGITVGDSDNVETGGNLIVTGGDDPGRVGDTDTVTATDPGLTNPSLDENSADFRPTSSSPAVGAAVPTRPHLATDRLGLRRDARNPTVGAYEAID